MPEEGLYIWEWYASIKESVYRIHDGYYRVIPFSELLAWSKITRNIVFPREYDILIEMDKVFCEEVNKEIESVRVKQEEMRKRELEQKRRS